MRRSRYDEFLDMQAQETDDCILWPYSPNNKGYGRVSVGGDMKYVHRLSCILAHGEPATAAHTDAAHSCRSRNCMNPRHLRWATVKENCADKQADGTSNRGVQNGSARLAEGDVLAIRRHPHAKRTVVSRWYSVHPSTISLILSRTNWKWLT